MKAIVLALVASMGFASGACAAPLSASRLDPAVNSKPIIPIQFYGSVGEIDYNRTYRSLDYGYRSQGPYYGNQGSYYDDRYRYSQRDRAQDIGRGYAREQEMIRQEREQRYIQDQKEALKAERQAQKENFKAQLRYQNQMQALGQGQVQGQGLSDALRNGLKGQLQN